MNEIIVKYLIANPYLSLLSILLAIVGIAVAIYFYVKGKKERKPTYALKNVNLIKVISDLNVIPHGLSGGFLIQRWYQY